MSKRELTEAEKTVLRLEMMLVMLQRSVREGLDRGNEDDLIDEMIEHLKTLKQNDK